jgi:hypothetical protein
MARRILGAIGATGASLVLVAALWVFTHLRDVPEVADADLRTIHAVASDADAAPDLYRADSLLHIEESQKENLSQWAKGKSWDDAGVTTLLAENAAALEALTAADGKPGFAVPPEHAARSPSSLDPVLEDTLAWMWLKDLRLLRALRLQRHGQTRAALAEILATARLGYVIQGAANGSLTHYLTGRGIRIGAFERLIEIAASSKLPRETLLALSAEVATLDANDRGFADALAGEYRVDLGFLEEVSVSSRAPDKGAKNLLSVLVGDRSARALGTVLPVEYLYQPRRSAALWAGSYRSLQRSIGQTYLVYSRESHDMNTLELHLRLVLGPNAVGLALWHENALWNDFVAWKCGENVRAAATSTILALLAYEHEHGSLPDRLDELVPGELSQVPIDDFDGAPLRYSRERRRLWSVGTELRDEGGSDPGTTPAMKQPTFFIPG